MSSELWRRLDKLADAIAANDGDPVAMHRVVRHRSSLVRLAAKIVAAAGVAAMKLETRGGTNVADSAGAYRVLMDALVSAMDDVDRE